MSEHEHDREQPLSADLSLVEHVVDTESLFADLVFVTYTRSRINDKEEFLRCLRQSLSDSLPGVSATEIPSVEIFGCRRLHEDGAPHYHVLLKFSNMIHWRTVRKILSVWIDVEGNREVDTTAITVRKKPHWESRPEFLQCAQAYIAKDGDVFGHWIC